MHRGGDKRRVSAPSPAAGVEGGQGTLARVDRRASDPSGSKWHKLFPSSSDGSDAESHPDDEAGRAEVDGEDDTEVSSWF